MFPGFIVSFVFIASFTAWYLLLFKMVTKYIAVEQVATLLMEMDQKSNDPDRDVSDNDLDSD